MKHLQWLLVTLDSLDPHFDSNVKNWVPMTLMALKLTEKEKGGKVLRR